MDPNGTSLLIAALVGGIIGFVSGGIGFKDGKLSWDWKSAIVGGITGAVTGAIGGFLSSSVKVIGQSLLSKGIIGKIGYAGIQGVLNAGIAIGMSTFRLTKNEFSLDKALIAGTFGFLGGVFGAYFNLKSGTRETIFALATGSLELIVGKIDEINDSKQFSFSY